ncbi:MAG TPA: NAD+ synthase [Gammaproteobacteria bacterium]|nr:NAD+ synthase [Gammaproteobacteria bacterium]
MKTLPIGLAQFNFHLGDIDGNVHRIISVCEQARDMLGCRIVVFPELAVTGYPPEDLLFRQDFLEKAESGVAAIASAVQDIGVVVGHPCRDGGFVRNSASVIDGGEIIARYHKRELPNYSVFDEKRYFKPGDAPCVVSIDGVAAAITVCEDIWHPGPTEDSIAAGAQIILNLNASPFYVHKGAERENTVVAERAKSGRVPIVYVNLVGGQDELVFDGGSFSVNGSGEVVQRSPIFVEHLASVAYCNGDLTAVASENTAELPEIEESVYQALVTGTRDYVLKNGFQSVVLGLSGGIDSALTMAIAVDALGPERVQAILMPSRYTREISVHDARQEAMSLGVEHHTIGIESLVHAYDRELATLFEGYGPDATEENLQARIRGNLLMAISNKTGRLVLTTGNKSEMAVGYATLYGDMAGGFAVIKDVPKTLVYRLARYRNEISAVIPERVITRAPSAELAPDQKDEDSLPPYDELDPILEAYIEKDQSPAQIVSAGYDAVVVDRIIGLVNRNEYKRRQAPPGVKITQRAFGRDRRYPITSGFR